MEVSCWAGSGSSLPSAAFAALGPAPAPAPIRSDDEPLGPLRRLETNFFIITTLAGPVEGSTSSSKR